MRSDNERSDDWGDARAALRLALVWAMLGGLLAGATRALAGHADGVTLSGQER